MFVEVHCRLELNYASPGDAEKVLRAVAVDNEKFVDARREGKSIISEITTDSILKLVHTLDDYLACVSVAEKSVKVAGKLPRARRQQRPSRR